MIQKKAKKGYWLDAKLLLDLMIPLHNDAARKRKEIMLVTSPEKDKLDAIMLTLKSLIEFVQENAEYGNLRVR